MRRFRLALLLAWVAGFVDATGFITLSHIFTSHMSGNTVAAAARLGSGQWRGILHRIVPIPVFVLGVFVGALVGVAAKRWGFRRRWAPSFILEALLLSVVVGLTTLPGNGVHPLPPGRAYPFVALMAAAMGLQNATLRRAGGLVVRTTFITGMLVNAAEQTAAWLLRKLEDIRALNGTPALPRNRPSRSIAGRRALKFFTVWCSLFAGATLGGYLAMRWGLICLLVPLALLVAIIVQDFITPLSPV